MSRITLVVILIFCFGCEGERKKRSISDHEGGKQPHISPAIDVDGKDLELAKCMKIVEDNSNSPINGFDLVIRFRECKGDGVGQFRRVVSGHTRMLPDSPEFVPSIPLAK